MVCVICSSGINRPAVCPPLRPLSVFLALLPLSFHHPPSSSPQQGQQPMWCLCTFLYSVCLFVCLCLLHNSWIWFVLLNLVMVLIIAVKTHTNTEREVLAHVYFAVMRHREHKVECEFTYVGDIFYIRVIFLYFATNSALLDISSQTPITKVMVWMTAYIKVNTVSVELLYSHTCHYVHLCVDLSLCACACV